MTAETTQTTPSKGRFDWLHVSLITLLVIIVSVLVTIWVVKTYIFPTEFKPVTLSSSEQRVLDKKLEALDFDATGRLNPEKYSEEGAERKVAFSEKELNALLASNTDLARKLAIDLSQDLVSAKLLVPVDEDFPVFGGKTLKVKAGVEFAYRDARPVVILKGISIMGVPMPNSWIGGIKNIDLVREFGNENGFWKAFADGVEHIKVEEGQLMVELKE
jgi:hypothetical protein